MNRPTALTILVVLALALSAPSSTQDIGKPSSGQASAESQKEALSLALKTYRCAAKCGFSVTSRNEDEVVGIVIGHLRSFHQKSLTPDEVKARLTLHQQEGKEKKRK